MKRCLMKRCFLNALGRVKSCALNELKMKKIKILFIAVLFFFVHFYFYAPFVLLANNGDDCSCGLEIGAAADCIECIECIECTECIECFGVAEAKEVSARAALERDQSIKKCDEHLMDYQNEEGNIMEYGVFLITCFIMNGVAIGMVLLGHKRRSEKDLAKIYDDECGTDAE